MFYTSMLGEVNGTFCRKRSFPIMIDTEGVSSGDVTIRVHNGVIRVGAGIEGNELFCAVGGDDFIPTNYEPALPFTNADLADTEDNPLIVVLTNAVRFYADTPCLIKTLFINNDMMLVELVYGACEFAFADGSFVPLQRCDDSDLNRKKVAMTLDIKALSERVLNSTKGGWDKKYEMVNPLCIICGRDGDNARFRFLKDAAYVFNQDCIDEQEALEEKARIDKANFEELQKELASKHLEEAKQRREEESKRLAEEKRQKDEEARAKRAATRRASKPSVVETATVTRQMTGQDFLAAVARL